MSSSRRSPVRAIDPASGVRASGGRDPDLNLVVLRGILERAPEERLLASGVRLLTHELVMRTADGAADHVTVVWPDPPSRRSPLAVGALVVVVGRVRRRFFRAGGVTQSRTEVVAERVVPARPAARAQALIDAAVAGVLGVLVDPASPAGDDRAGPGRVPTLVR